jgi:hypothetical protein
MEDEAGFSAGRRSEQIQHLLDAFKYYAASAERARLEDWPDEAWRNWRYRRASLARILGASGNMQQVADIYQATVQQYAPERTTLWMRFASSLGIHAQVPGTQLYR